MSKEVQKEVEAKVGKIGLGKVKEEREERRRRRKEMRKEEAEEGRKK